MTLPKLSSLKRHQKDKVPVNKTKKSERNSDGTFLPKSQYDSNGKPILTIPDLDDTRLSSASMKYLSHDDEYEDK